MSMIPGGGTPGFYASIPSGPSSVGTTNDVGSIFADLKKKEKDSSRPTRMQKFADAVDKSLKYKEQKKVDAEIGTDKDKDKDAAGPKGFKISPDTTVVSGYRDPGFTLAGQKGRSFGGLIGTLGGAAIGLANPAIGAAMGSSIGGRVGSYFD
tara:strand:- start:48 stop:503 length:456 start_codon:yes stop_codon:yes gene_type:complete